MSGITAPIFDFKSGILSKKLLARQDLKILKSGLLQGENFITQIQGAQEFRPGFIYIRRTRHNLPAQLWQFVFNDEQAFVLEFTDYFLRFYTQEGVITESAKTITAATNASPGVFTSAGHGYVTGDEVFLDGLVGAAGLMALNGQFYNIVRINNDTYSLKDLDGVAINTTSLGAYASGGTTRRVYEIATPYTKVQAEKIKLAGTADLRYLVDGVHMPRKLKRISNTNWTLTTFVRTSDPFEQTAITGITQANPAAVTAVAHGRATGDQVFLEDITGMTELNNRSFTITVVDVDHFTLNGENSSAYTAYSSGGIQSLLGNAPRAVGLYGASLFYGGSDNDPDIFHKSRSPDPSTGEPRYDDFTVGSDPEDSVSLPISAIGEGVARIRFFAGTRSFLAVGMYGGMAKINGGQDSVPITNTDIAAPPVDAYGVADVSPVLFGTDILYVQRGETNINSFVYSLQNDGFESFDSMLQSDELSTDGVCQLAYQQGNPSLVWALLNSGKLLSLTYRRTETVVAWNTHTVGLADGVVSIAGEPQASQHDRLWICVARTIDGVLRYMMEVSAANPIIPEFKDFFTGVGNKVVDTKRYLDMMFEAQRRSFHLDSALILDTTQTTTITPAAVSGDNVLFTAGASIFASTDIGRFIRVKHLEGGEVGIAEIVSYVSGTQVRCNIVQNFASTTALPSGAWYFTQNTLSGLGHLEGETISILEDGAASEPKEVVDGEVELDDQCCVAIAGVPYTGILETMPAELLLSAGVTSGKTKTIGLVKFLFRNTLGVSYGNDIYNPTKMKFRSGADIAGRPAPLFSGYKELPGFDDYGIDRTYKVIQTQPFPCTVQSIILDMEVPFES